MCTATPRSLVPVTLAARAHRLCRAFGEQPHQFHFLSIGCDPSSRRASVPNSGQPCCAAVYHRHALLLCCPRMELLQDCLQQHSLVCLKLAAWIVRQYPLLARLEKSYAGQDAGNSGTEWHFSAE